MGGIYKSDGVWYAYSPRTNLAESNHSGVSLGGIGRDARLMRGREKAESVDPVNLKTYEIY